jgi:flagellar motor switch protein FliG
MSLERYLKDENGLRKYVQLMETTPPTKRKTLMDAGRAENSLFVETAEQYIITFEKITRLPEMELTEVLGDTGLKIDAVAAALLSIADTALREKLVALIPKKTMPFVVKQMQERPDPKLNEIGQARLAFIQKARELESEGKLKSLQLPLFPRDHFQPKTPEKRSS